MITCFNPLTAGAAYIRLFIFYSTLGPHFKYVEDINQQDLKRVDLHFVKFE